MGSDNGSNAGTHSCCCINSSSCSVSSPPSCWGHSLPGHQDRQGPGGVKYSYDSAVSKQLQNLVVSGPPAEDIGFSGSATYQQEAYPHVPPFLAFSKTGYSA